MDYQEANRIAEALERLADIMAHPLQAVECSTETTTPKRTRNEEARCGNCPYGLPRDKGVYCGKSALVMHTSTDTLMAHDGWCGDHPDFWKETQNG